MKVRVCSNFIVNLDNVTSFGFVHFETNVVFNFDDEEMDVIDTDEIVVAPTEDHWYELNEKFMSAVAAQQPFFDAYKELLNIIITNKKREMASSLVER